MSFRAVVLSKSKSAKGAPSVTEPDLPQVPSLLSMSLIGLRLPPPQPASTRMAKAAETHARTVVISR
jgi:hypothetical protein